MKAKKQKNSWELHALTGRVKSFSTKEYSWRNYDWGPMTKYNYEKYLNKYTVYKFNEKGYVSQHIFYNKDLEVISKTTYKYIEDNQFKEIQHTYPLENKSMKTIYEYDENYKLQKMFSYMNYDYNNCPDYFELSSTNYYKYDDTGFLTSVSSILADGRESFTNYYVKDDEGKDTKAEHGSKGKIKHSTKNDYDENNNIILTKNYNENNELESRIVNKYDRNNNLIEEICYSGDFKIVYRAVKTYDSFNNMIKEEMFGKDNEFERATNIILEYDNMNNWSKRFTYMNDMLFSVYERSFEYFD